MHSIYRNSPVWVTRGPALANEIGDVPLGHLHRHRGNLCLGLGLGLCLSLTLGDDALDASLGHCSK